MFSDRERLIIKVLGRRRMTLDELSSGVFKDVNEKPFDDTQTIANSIRRINKKCSHYGLNWILGKQRKDKKLTIKKESLI